MTCLLRGFAWSKEGKKCTKNKEVTRKNIIKLHKAEKRIKEENVNWIIKWKFISKLVCKLMTANHFMNMWMSY